MPKRRPPSLRRTNSTSSSSTTTSSRRNADTRNLITATNVFGGQEVGGFLRALLLGAFVGGLVIFLFYPDISGLLEHWQNSSEPSGLLQTSATGKDENVRNEGPKSQSVNWKKENSHPRSNSKRSEPVKEAQKAKPAKKKKKEKEVCWEDPTPSCPCTCEQPVTPPPKCDPPPKKSKVAKKEKAPKESLMEEEEEEEVVEEIDSVEVELMEEEEPVEFIELDPEEDSASASSPAIDEHSDSEVTDNGEAQISHDDVQANRYSDDELLASEDSRTLTHDKGPPVSEDSQPNIPSMGEPKEEPLVLTDGQPITFTPVSPGDENFIRVGGRPKPNKDSVRQAEAHTTPTKHNSSAKSNASKKQSSGKAKRNKAENPRHSQTKESESKKKASGKSKDTDKGSTKEALPEEVKNFQPTFLKTVTAKKIFADGRRIPPVELLPQKETNSSVKVFLFNEFLSEAECDGLRRVHDKHVQDMASKPLLCFDSLSTLRKHLHDVKRDVRVTPNDFVTGTKCLNGSFSRQLGEWLKGNWSYSTAFYPGESRFSSIVAARVQHAMGLEPRNGGKFQITSYPTGKAYKAHTDCVLEGTDPRDRVATVLVYLDDVEDGGETKFPELGIWVKPRKGRALVWNNMSPKGLCEPHSLHVASKVNTGSKYILIRWYYYKSFYSLGKRPPEPSLPSRALGTPRVSCDDYDNGSCRWYDEWNNDHLLDYEYNKYTFI